MKPLVLPLVLAAAALLAPALPARADEVRALRLGDSLTGNVEAGTLEAVPFDAVKGTLLDVDLKMAEGSGPAVAILQPNRTLLASLPAFSKVDGKNAALKVRKAPLEQSGRHWVLVQPTVPGAYKLTVKGKPLKKTVLDGFISPFPPSELEFGAVPGALLTITAKASAGSTLSPKVLWVKAPGGAFVDLATADSHSFKSTSDVYKSIPLSFLGKYTIGIGTSTGIYGDYGRVQVTVKFAGGKKATYPDTDVVIDPFVDGALPDSGFDNLAYPGVLVSGEFFREGAAVRLEGPANIDGTSVARLDDQTLSGDFDLAGAPTGDYDIVVSYPNGAEGRKTAGFEVKPTPIPSGVLPSSGFDNRTQPFSVNGSRFQTGVAVSLVPSAGGQGFAATVLSSTATSALVSFPLLDKPLGAYDLVVTNPDGGTNTLAGAFTVVRGPRLSTASPLLGHDNEASVPVVLGGQFFQAGLGCDLELAGQTPITAVVSGLTASSATATFDLRNKVAGAWTLRVTNLDGGTITLPSTFAITRAPRPGAVTGGRLFEGYAGTGLALAGTDFVSGAQVTFEVTGSTTASATSEAVDGPGTQITFDVATAGLARGDHDVRVVNPDGGTDLSPAAVTILGRRTLTSDGVSAGRPSAAYNAEDDEYMAVYSVFDGTQRDVRARRYSAATGKPLGNEILVTTSSLDPGSTVDQFQPCAVYAPSLHFWLVVYAWNDPASGGDQSKIYAQIVHRDGTLQNDQTTAQPVFSSSAGTITGPRVAWNSTRSEWLVVFGFGGTSSDVYYSCLAPGIVLGDGTQLLSVVSSGTLIATFHTVTIGGNSADIDDKDFDPDVAWSSTRNEYAVSWTLDVVEAGDTIPPDTGSDVRARIYDGDFSAGPVQRASLTTLGNVSNKNEGHSGVASSGATYLVAWDYDGGGGNRDVQCWLLNATTRAKIGSLVAVEQTATDDAALPALAWDATAAATGYLVSYPLFPGASGSSSSILTRLPQSGTTATGTAVHRTVAAALSNAAFAAGGVATRGTGGEFMASWTVSGSALSPADAEVTITK
jgi:hypothetical protein